MGAPPSFAAFMTAHGTCISQADCARRDSAHVYAAISRTTPSVLTTAEREELSRLRKENRELRMERDILKKAAAFFAKEST
jgi:transposase-like protein